MWYREAGLPDLVVDLTDSAKDHSGLVDAGIDTIL